MSTEKNNSRFWVKLFLATLVLGAVLAFVPFGQILAFISFDHVVSLVQGARSNFWTFVIFYVCFAFGVMALPITIFPVIGGVLFDFWIALPMNLLAATLGAWMSYLVTRYFGRDPVHFFLRGKMKSIDRYTNTEGLKTLFILRLIGIPPFIVTNYAMGLSTVKSWEFILATSVGILPWLTFVTIASHSLWQAALQGGQKGFATACATRLGPVMLLSFTIAGILAFVERRKKKKAHAQNSSTRTYNQTPQP